MSIWRPHTTAILVGGVLLIIVAVAIAFIVINFQPKTDVRMGSGVFSTRVAKDDASRQKGLSGVESLKPNEGLLMIFDTDDTWAIWMKDMKVPIDIIWLDKNKKVVYMVKNAAPELSTDKTFKPNAPARYVVELPAGAIQQYDIRIGETAIFVVAGEAE